MCVVSLPRCPPGPFRMSPIWLKDMENRTRIHSPCTHTPSCTHIVYTLSYTHTHKRCCCTYWPSLSLSQFRLYSLIRAPRTGYGFRFVLRANSKYHIQWNRILLFTYCPRQLPSRRNSRLFLYHISNPGITEMLWDPYKKVFFVPLCAHVYTSCNHFYRFISPVWSLCFCPRRISGNQLRYISGQALQGLHNLKVL